MLAGATAERVLDRFLRRHRDLEAPGRAACAEALLGVGLWRRRLRHALGGAPGSPRLLLALLLRDLAGRDDAAELAGLPPGGWPPAVPPPVALADRASLPDWLAAELVLAAGGEAEALADALNLPGPVALRANRLRGDRGGLAEALARQGVGTRPSALAPDGLVITSPRANVRGLEAWRDGRCEVQDEGSQLLALALGARRGERVLDRCAGAGGKALALAAAVGPGGGCWPATPTRSGCGGWRSGPGGPAPRPSWRCWAPRRPRRSRWTARWSTPPAPSSGRCGGARTSAGGSTRAASRRCRRSSSRCCETRARCVRPGGRLVYATCTFRREENEAVALAFEAAEPGCAARRDRGLPAPPSPTGTGPTASSPRPGRDVTSRP